MGDANARVTKSQSQIASRRKRAFAAAWIPAKYLRGNAAPIVLTLFPPYRDRSERLKEVIEPAPGRFTHHFELAAVDDVDAEVKA